VSPADAFRKRLIIRKPTSLLCYIILTVTSATISKAGVGTANAVPTRLNVPGFIDLSQNDTVYARMIGYVISIILPSLFAKQVVSLGKHILD
jgi:hypothetical protein